MAKCESTYKFPSGIEIKCSLEEGHKGQHNTRWTGEQGDYKTWWD